MLFVNHDNTHALLKAGRNHCQNLANVQYIWSKASVAWVDQYQIYTC